MERAFVKEVHRNENDISAEKKTEVQSSWIQSQNEDERRKKSYSCKKSKRQKEIISIGRIYVAFFSSMKFSESLKKNKDFQYVYQNGKSYANKYLVMYVLENNMQINRLGISASKKTGNSVVRHRFTRLVRESYRLHENIFNSGLDIVVIARKSAASVSYQEMESALLHLAKLHHIIKIFFYE